MYKIIDGQIIRISDGVIVPQNDPGYLDWVATSPPEPLGNVPLRIRDMTEAEILRRGNAKTEAKLATQLRTLTPQQTVDYIETNVTNLASAKIVIKIMARMLIAMRDEIWPDLSE